MNEPIGLEPQRQVRKNYLGFVIDNRILVEQLAALGPLYFVTTDAGKTRIECKKDESREKKDEKKEKKDESREKKDESREKKGKESTNNKSGSSATSASAVAVVAKDVGFDAFRLMPLACIATARNLKWICRARVDQDGSNGSRVTANRFNSFDALTAFFGEFKPFDHNDLAEYAARVSADDVLHFPQWLRYRKEIVLDEPMATKIIANNPLNLAHIPSTFLIPRSQNNDDDDDDDEDDNNRVENQFASNLCMSAVQSDGEAIEFVPDAIITQEHVVAALSHTPIAYRVLSRRFRTPEVYLAIPQSRRKFISKFCFLEVSAAPQHLQK